MCPHCSTSGMLQLYSRYVADIAPAQRVATGLTGSRLKLALVQVATVRCWACGWYSIGHLEDARLDGVTFVAGRFVPDAPPVAP